MDLKKKIQEAVLGNDREKSVPHHAAGKVWYYIRYDYLQLLGQNFLFLLCCLPLVTIPGACCGLSAVAAGMVRDKAVPTREVFFREMKTDFWKRLVLWILLCIFPISLGFYAQCFGLESSGTITRLIGFAVVFLIQRYWYICMALIEATPWQNLKNAILLAAVEWKRTLLLMTTVGLLYGVCFLFPLYGFPVMLLCLFSVCYLLSATLLTPAVLKHLALEEPQEGGTV